MKNIHNDKKAVSPVVATVLMILIVMAGMTILFAFVSDYAQSFHSGSGSAVLESIAIEDVWFNPADPHNVEIWVYNVGKVGFTINSIYINDTSYAFTVNSSSISPPIAVTEHAKVVISSLPWADVLGSQSYNIKIVTNRGSGFEGTHSPQS